MRAGPFVLVALLLLSGCVGSADKPAISSSASPTPPSAAVGPNFTAGIVAPSWNVGDWWQYSVDYNSGEKYDARIVVYRKDGNKYLITSDSRDLVLRSSFNHYPNLSPVTAGAQDQFIHGVQVGYLKFPMKNQTWSAQYRDFPMNYASQFAMLEVGSEQVPGFVTTMAPQSDGKLRMAHGWSPVTKWFTNLTWDFDGVAPIDVTVRLKAWGSNFTGVLPVVDLVEIVHRAFPTATAPPNTQGATPNPQQASVAFKVGVAGSTLIVGMFAGSGGQGSFQVTVAQQGGTAQPTRYEWQPTAAASHFQWNQIKDPAVGDWQLGASGAAQNSAFLFVEAYEARTMDVSL